jgi:prolipoprotein diacylglyceryltransferase
MPLRSITISPLSPTTWSAGPEFGPKWYPLALVALALPSVWAGGKLARRATAEN